LKLARRRILQKFGFNFFPPQSIHSYADRDKAEAGDAEESEYSTYSGYETDSADSAGLVGDTSADNPGYVADRFFFFPLVL
jgi:hypothetical protein